MSEVSNVRRRKRISSQAEDFDPQEELLQAASEGRRSGLFPKAQDAEPDAFTSNERIWVNFGIKPNLPTRTKIEQLLILYRLPLDEIANILDLELETVEDIVSTLNSEWAALGKVMTPEERDVARGRMIADLLRLKAEIEDAMIGAAPTDKARMLTLKMNVVNQLTQLQGLSLDKKDVPRPEDEIVDPIEEKVNALSEERQKQLHDRLKAAAH